MRRKIVNDMVEGCAPIMARFILATLLCLALSFCSCKPQKEIQVERVEVPVVVTQEHTVESVKIDHVRDTVIQRDSIIRRDSVFQLVKGDTVIIERWHYTTDNHHYTNNNVVTKVDTLFKTDSVQVPVEVVKEKVVTKIQEVEKKLSWLQKTLIYTGGLSLILVVLLVAWRIGRKKLIT